MTGRRTFVAGEVLTASNVNSFLMNQVVSIFANAGARASAIPSPIQGNLTYLQDADRLDRWNGSAWVPVVPTPEPRGVIATKTRFFTGTRTQGVNVGTNYVIPDTTISHAVSKVGNSVILFGQLTGSYPGNQAADSLIAGSLTENGNMINIGNAAGGRTRVSGYNIGPILPDSFSVGSLSFVARYTPPSTAARTYGVAINSTQSGTWFINRSAFDGNNNNNVRGATGLVLMEVTD